jgi:hypothetical protein
VTVVYAAIGRLVVAFVRRRYRRQIQAAAAFTVAAVAIGAYLATRDEDDER